MNDAQKTTLKNQVSKIQLVGRFLGAEGADLKEIEMCRQSLQDVINELKDLYYEIKHPLVKR